MSDIRTNAGAIIRIPNQNLLLGLIGELVDLSLVSFNVMQIPNQVLNHDRVF
jgi:hypothetical protein